MENVIRKPPRSDSLTITISEMLLISPSSSFIIFLLFHSLALISAGHKGATPAAVIKPNGHNANKVKPAELFGWDRGLEAPSYDQSHPYVVAQEFVTVHNWIRKQYKEPLYKWDEKLASFARQYAMQRYNDGRMIHSDASYGENILWGKNLRSTASDAVYSWYVEKEWFDLTTLNCSAPPGESCGHFTQITWRDSVRVGCAIQHCRNKKAGMLIHCEYDPPGNFNDENPLDNNNAKFFDPLRLFSNIVLWAKMETFFLL